MCLALLGRLLILCPRQRAGRPQIAHPVGGMAHFLQVTALKPLGNVHPVWCCTCWAQVRTGSLSGDIGFRPGTPGGFGADSAVACVLFQGDLRLRSAIVRPIGGTHVRLQDERRVCLASLGPICDGA